jgi:hypothetical protein
MSETTTTDDIIDVEGTGAGIHEGIAVDSEGNALTAEQVEALREPAQPEEQAAEVQPVDNSTEPKVESASNVDPDLIKWAEKKGGFDTTDLTPTAIKALERARRTEQEYHRNNVEKSNLQKSLQPQYNPYQQPQYPQYQPPAPEQQLYDYNGNPVNIPVPQPQAPVIDTDLAMLKFQVNHKDYEVDSPLDEALGEVVAEDPLFWASRLDQAYRIAKANLSSGDVETRIEQARREERERLTRKTSLSQPQSQATAPTQGKGFRNAADAENFMNTASKDDFNARIPEMEAALGLELRPK